MLSSHDLVSAQWLGNFGWGRGLPCSSMGELVERLAGIRRFLGSNPVHRFHHFFLNYNFYLNIKLVIL